MSLGNTISDNSPGEPVQGLDLDPRLLIIRLLRRDKGLFIRNDLKCDEIPRVLSHMLVDQKSHQASRPTEARLEHMFVPDRHRIPQAESKTLIA